MDQLERSFDAMPRWVKMATKHAMAAPEIGPDGKRITSFRQAIEYMSDEGLLVLKDDFEGNGDLLPSIATQ